MVELDAVAVREVLEILGQILGARHLGLVDEHRDDRNVALQRACRLQPDEVERVVEATLAFRIGDGEPVLADDREQHAARCNLLLDRAPKVTAGLDAGNVHEHRVLAESIAQIFEQAPGVAFGVVAPVADEDSAHLCVRSGRHDPLAEPHEAAVAPGRAEQRDPERCAAA